MFASFIAHQVPIGVVLLVPCGSIYLLALFWGSPAFRIFTSKCLYRVWAFAYGVPLVMVSSDAKMASAILKQFTQKGEAIENEMGVVPLWREGMNAFFPLVPIDAADGKRHRQMVSIFEQVKRHAASPQEIYEIAVTKSHALLEQKKKCDDHIVSIDIVRLTIAIFVKSVFQRDWEDQFEILVTATLEWRQAIFGKRNSDQQLLNQAVAFVVNVLLRENQKLWGLYNEDWRKPEYFSTIMFTYIISPAINNVELLVAMKKHTMGGQKQHHFSSSCVDAALDKAHIMHTVERFVDTDFWYQGRLAIKRGTHVLIFPASLSGTEWPLWGNGKRSCPGQVHASKTLIGISEVLMENQRFHPEIGNRYSGRDNDAAWNPREAFSRLGRIVQHFIGKEPTWNHVTRINFKAA